MQLVSGSIFQVLYEACGATHKVNVQGGIINDAMDEAIAKGTDPIAAGGQAAVEHVKNQWTFDRYRRPIHPSNVRLAQKDPVDPDSTTPPPSMFSPSPGK